MLNKAVIERRTSKEGVRLIRFMSLVLVAFMSVPALAGGMSGEIRSTGEMGSISVGAGSWSMYGFDMPAGAVALRAVMDVTPLPLDRIAPIDPVLSICGTAIWAFNGTGFGTYGRQTLFSDGSTSKTFSFGEGGGTETSRIRLPRGATVNEAKMDIGSDGGTWGWNIASLRGPGADAHFGYAVAPVGDVNGDGFDDFLVGAPFYSVPGKENVGMAGLYLGGPRIGKEPDLFIAGSEPGQKMGFSVSGAGDFNGDGYDDFVVGAPGGYYENGDESAERPGQVLLFLGGPVLHGEPDHVFHGRDTPDFGYSVSGGDVNGDGLGDVLICAPRESYLYDNGLIYIYYGNAQPDDKKAYTIYNNEPNARAYDVFCVGDVNNDGADDFLAVFLAPPTNGRCQAVVPEVYWRAALFLGGGRIGNEKIVFSQGGDDLTCAFSGAGDLNADGYDDMLLGGVWGAAAAGRPGLASVYRGGPAMDNVSDFIVPWGAMEGGKVIETAPAGDVNGDGYDDAMLGVYFGQLQAPTAPGIGAIYFGGPEFDTLPDLTFRGKDPMDFFGGVVSSAGDVNRDGRDEFIIASAGEDANGRDSGAVRLYYQGYGLTGSSLAIGDVPFWGQEGLVNASGPCGDFSAGLTAYLKTAPASGTDRYGNEYVDVPVRASSQGRGNITLGALGIRYNCTVTLADFSAAINAHPGQGGADAGEPRAIRIMAECSTPVRFSFSNLELRYGFRPRLLGPVPEMSIMEESADYGLVDLWDYFKDDMDENYELEFEVLSADNADAVNVSVVMNRYLMAEARDGPASVNWTGEVRVKVGCTDLDGLLGESNEFSTFVTNTQDAPVITSEPPTRAVFGTKYIYRLEAFDADADTLHYWLIDAPSGMRIDEATGEIGWYPAVRGLEEVRVMVTDGKDRDWQNFTIDVWKNTSPVILDWPRMNAFTGETYVCDVKAFDEEGDRIHFELRTAAEGLSIDADTGRMVWTPSEEQVGRHAVAVVVTDGYGGSNELYFVMEVHRPAAADPPVEPAGGDVPGPTSAAADGTPPVSRDIHIESPVSSLAVSPVPVLLLVLFIAVFVTAGRRVWRCGR